jgi:hypothetical protein
MDSHPRIFIKIFLSFPGPPPTRYGLSFFIYKKLLKFDGGYCLVAGHTGHSEEIHQRPQNETSAKINFLMHIY